MWGQCDAGVAGVDVRSGVQIPLSAFSFLHVFQSLASVPHHHERPHQRKGNVALMPAPAYVTARRNSIRCRERLGGLLKSYDREAA